MPDVEFPKLRPHPFRRAAQTPDPPADRALATSYAELCTASNFSFLHGASHPEELVYAAAQHGYQALALTDLHSLAGVVRAHVAARELGLQFIVGARLQPADLPHFALTVYPTDRAAYGRLCRLLTVGKRRAPKGECRLCFADVTEHAAGLLAILLPDLESPGESIAEIESALARCRSVFDADRLSLGLCLSRDGADTARLARALAAGDATGVPLAATCDALYHAPQRRPLQDALTCIRHGCTLSQAGLRLQPGAERHLKPTDEIARRFAAVPDALHRTVTIAQRTAGFSLDQLRYDYPAEVVPPGLTPMQHLTDLTWRGAAERYPDGVPAKVRAQIEHELRLIDDLSYARYFLTVHDLAHFARQRGILYQGRGAAANSAVCYCLRVTAVDAAHIDMLFERFVSKERNEPPDIDIDFEHERREEVIQYIYAKYGRERAALTAEVITYRRRSAVRDVGKALGFSLDLVDALAKDGAWWEGEHVNPARLREMGLNPADDTVQWFLRLTGEVLGFPRHLSQHVGGFVISQPPLCELVPIENAAMPDRTVIEWDKDDIDALGLLKVDVLGLGMLTALRRCLHMVNTRHATDLSLANIPADDPDTYAMIQQADTVGVFQIESRAQMSMLPRLRPACYYDLVIEVAIVRPGPIQGDMVHPYLRRRQGLEPIHYVHPIVEQVLKKTLGVPLFQEQCMSLAIKAAGFTPGEADQLRRAMAAWKRKGDQLARFSERLIAGMIANNIPREFAEACVQQIRGFSEYGFPESHAASFALLVYASAWLKRHYPAEFTAALLNSQPMGFYAPAQLIRDARAHGVEIRPVDINESDWDCTLTPDGALRLGLRLVSGVGEKEGRQICDAVRLRGRFNNLLSLWRASGVRAATLRRLASADAFSSLGLSRQKALWLTRGLKDETLPLFDRLDEQRPPHADLPLPAFSDAHEVSQDYAATGLSLRNHPLAFVRADLCRAGVRPCADLKSETATPHGEWAAVAGLVLVRQRPGTAGGVVFMTLEDESGTANLVIWERVYNRYRRITARQFLIVRGRVQRQDGVVHVVAVRLQTLESLLQHRPLEKVTLRSRDFH